MARVELVTSREALDGLRAEVFDRIVAERGAIPVPFLPLLHSPEVADATSSLGSALAGGELPPAVREMAIVTTAHERRCEFEVRVHSRKAVEAGVDPADIASVRDGRPVKQELYGVVVDFVRGACRVGSVDEELFESARSQLGERGIVELVALIGYYSYISLLMAVFELD